MKSSYSAAGRKVVCRYSSSRDTLSIRVLKAVIDPTAFQKLFSGKGVGKTVKGACTTAKGLSGSPAPTIYAAATARLTLLLHISSLLFSGNDLSFLVLIIAKHRAAAMMKPGTRQL